MGYDLKLQEKAFFQAFTFSLFVVLAAQLSLNLFVSDFQISIAVICIPALIYLRENLAVFAFTMFSAAGIFLSRVLVDWVRTGQIPDALHAYIPEFVFYIIFGIFFFLFTTFLRKPNWKFRIFVPAVMLMDYISNACELFIRMQSASWDIYHQGGILLVAIARGLILLGVLSIFSHYRLSLLNKSHQMRYQRLMMLSARLNAEMIWMKKSTSLIERTMANAYSLQKELKNKGDSDLAKKALDVAKDVHEIKKEYLLIMRGLSESLETEAPDEHMNMSELLLFLKDSVEHEYRNEKKLPRIIIACDSKIETAHPYLYLSVFHNLVTNAVEASNKKNPTIRIMGTQGNSLVKFLIKDDGPGISEEDVGHIFEAGFSTKINFETGMINRGLGLSIVKDIVEEDLGGVISLLDTDRHGTEFTINVPREYNLEGTKRENLSLG